MDKQYFWRGFRLGFMRGCAICAGPFAAILAVLGHFFIAGLMAVISLTGGIMWYWESEKRQKNLQVKSSELR